MRSAERSKTCKEAASGDVELSTHNKSKPRGKKKFSTRTSIVLMIAGSLSVFIFLSIALEAKKAPTGASMVPRGAVETPALLTQRVDQRLHVFQESQ